MKRIRWIVTAAVAISATVLSAVVTGPAFADTLFTDNFDDGDATGWTRSGGSWAVVTDGTPAYRQSSTSASAKALAGTATWTDYTVSARVKPIAYGASTRSVGVAARARSTSDYYALVLTGSGAAQLQRVVGGGTTVLGTAAVGGTTGTWRTLTLTAQGSALTGFVDGNQVVQATDSALGAGRIGLIASYASATYDDVTVDTGIVTPTPSATTPTSPPPAGTCRVAGSAAGFASVNALGLSGTTGGAGGPTVAVDTAAELISAIGTAGPLTICVNGTITLPAGMYDVTQRQVHPRRRARPRASPAAASTSACRSRTRPRPRPARCTTSSSRTCRSAAPATTRSTCRCSRTTSGSTTTTWPRATTG